MCAPRAHAGAVSRYRGVASDVARLPHRFAERHRAGDRHIKRAEARPDRDDEPRVGGLVHPVGDAGRLAAEQQHVVGPVRVVKI